MHLISRKPLKLFWEKHPDAERPLRDWSRAARREEWHNFAEVRALYPHADKVENFVVFNIGGNKYRLVTAIHFNCGRVYVRRVMTHKEYDDGHWKND
jgi:mRNA interferase HigB